MKPFTILSTMSCLVLVLVLVVASVAGAQPQAVDRTTLEFSTPVMVPGATLPAGRYTFEVSGIESSRNVIQVWNEDKTRLMTTALAVPKARTNAKGDVVVTIARTDASMAPALKIWFYPGALRGHEFIYSEKQARALADETKTLVLSSNAPEGDDLDSMAKARLWHVGPGGERQEYEEKEPPTEP